MRFHSRGAFNSLFQGGRRRETTRSLQTWNKWARATLRFGTSPFRERASLVCSHPYQCYHLPYFSIFFPVFCFPLIICIMIPRALFISQPLSSPLQTGNLSPTLPPISVTSTNQTMPPSGLHSSGLHRRGQLLGSTQTSNDMRSVKQKEARAIAASSGYFSFSPKTFLARRPPPVLGPIRASKFEVASQLKSNYLNYITSLVLLGIFSRAHRHDTRRRVGRETQRCRWP